MDGYGQGVNGFRLLLVLKMKVKIDQIKFVKELYPRFELDNYVVNQYRQSIETLPPIVVSKNYVLIDGYHRIIAYKLEQIEEIEAEVLDIEDEKDIFLEAISRNSSHGKQLTIEEKSKLAPKLYEMGVTLEEIVHVLAVGKSKIYDWTKNLREKEEEKRDAEILELYLQCWTQEQIADKLGVDHRTIGRSLDQSIGQKSIDGKIPTPDNLQLYNVWAVDRLSLDQLKYPGQTPLNIVENLIYYYTAPPQLEPQLKLSKVLDPMAGSGIISQACQKLIRRYIMFDIKPLREDIPIKQNDILKGLPQEANKTDLVYFDPPYYNLMTEYPNNHFTETYETFLHSMEISFRNLYPILNGTGKIALILQPMNEEMLSGKWLDMTFDCISIAKNIGYQLEKRIASPLSTQQFNANDVTRAKEKKIMINTLRDIVILKKEN